MTDYSQGKIYVIKSSQTEDIYIGSTITTLSKRFGCHKNQCEKYLEGKSNYISSFEILKYEDAYIELLDDYPCNTKQELLMKEGEFQQKMKCVNKNIAGRTKKECINSTEYKEYRKKYMKEYNEMNKDKVKKQRDEYTSRPEVKERVKEISKEYRSKPEVIERRKEMMKCVCGKEILKIVRKRHMRSKVHNKYIEDMKEMGDQRNLEEFFEQFKFKI